LYLRKKKAKKKLSVTTVTLGTRLFFYSAANKLTYLEINAHDKIRKYRADYNDRPPSAVSFMPAIASTSGRIHSEFVRLLFLQDHRETDRFFAVSGVQLPETHRGMFHFRRTAFSSSLKAKVGSTLTKAAVLRATYILMGRLSLQELTLTRHTRRHLVY